MSYTSKTVKKIKVKCSNFYNCYRLNYWVLYLVEHLFLNSYFIYMTFFMINCPVPKLHSCFYIFKVLYCRALKFSIVGISSDLTWRAIYLWISLLNSNILFKRTYCSSFCLKFIYFSTTICVFFFIIHIKTQTGLNWPSLLQLFKFQTF